MSDCPTGKRRIPTEAQARADLVGAIIKANRGSQKRRECRYYACDACGGWHLTSHPKPPTRK
jgi:hypothetical protein